MSAVRVRRGGTTVAVFGVAFVVRFALGLVFAAPYVWDATLYERGARALAETGRYSCFLFGPEADARVLTAYYPVGYPAYLALFYVLFGVAPWVVTLAGSLAGALTAACTHRIALRITSERAALLGALAYALMPGPVLFAPAPMTETLWGAALTTAVWLFARGDRRSIVGATLALTVAVYVRAQALLLLPLLSMCTAGSPHTRVRRAVLVTVSALALVAPWTLRNCAALDGCVLLSANGGSNLAVGVVAPVDGTYRRLTDRDGCRGVVGEAARDRCWRGVAHAHMRANPTRWLRLAWPKLEHTLRYERAPVEYLAAAFPSRFDARDRVWGHRVLTTTWLAALFMALVALVPLRGRPKLGVAGHLATATIVTVVLTHVVFFGGDRYHLPLSGLVVALASAAWRGGANDRV
jgi:hypothetical protein